MAELTPSVVDVTDATFEQLVIEESDARPVVIDFWAPWCGPCRTLGPMLEDLVEEHAGAFLLAKVNVDESPQLAEAFRVQSIPTVYAVYQRAPLDQFMGAQPKPEVTRWLDGVLRRAGVSATTAREKVPKDPAQALLHWQRHLRQTPGDGRALLELGRAHLALGQPDDARQALDQVESNDESYADAQSILAVMGLHDEVMEAGGPEAVRARLVSHPDDARAAYLVACADAAQGDLVTALEVFVDLIGRGGTLEVRADAKRAATTVLQASGREDERVETLRRRLARLLF